MKDELQGLKDFMNEFQMEIRSTLTKTLNDTDYELIRIEEKNKELSEEVEPVIRGILAPYGLECVRFIISAIEIKDDELRKRYDEIGMDAIAKMRLAQADMAVMNTMGDNWQKQQAAQILRDLANNPGAGGVAAGGAGLGLGVAATGVFAGMAQQMMSPMNPSANQTVQMPQNQASSYTPSGRFAVKTPENNSVPNNAQATQDPVEVLGKLKQLLDLGLIERSVYDNKVGNIEDAFSKGDNSSAEEAITAVIRAANSRNNHLK